MPLIKLPPEPWLSLFTAIDGQLIEPVELHCCGGFVVTQFYGVARTTSDLDYIGAVPNMRGFLTT